jgi:hypothetical protein
MLEPRHLSGDADAAQERQFPEPGEALAQPELLDRPSVLSVAMFGVADEHGAVSARRTRM